LSNVERAERSIRSHTAHIWNTASFSKSFYIKALDNARTERYRACALHTGLVFEIVLHKKRSITLAQSVIAHAHYRLASFSSRRPSFRLLQNQAE
jgi:hypothetical protein